MFEKEDGPIYQAFFVEDDPSHDAVRVGFEWLADWGSREDDGIVVTPVADQYRYSSLTSVIGQSKPGEIYRLRQRRIHTSTPARSRRQPGMVGRYWRSG